jgi:Kef-type K+ transport system membrane component KefB/predicted amino acid-binding ACT domain protein
MDVGDLLVTLIVLLLAARVAAEVADRLGQPAVLAEIVVGVLIGPSLLGLVRDSGAVDLLAEIGVILLLFEVGRQMDLRELGRVGGASLRVAAIGVAVPMAVGFVALMALGLPSTVALFLAGGITATSVGVTARVFGDLGALSRREAATVLGAAVADDVIGLLVLTVVIRVAIGENLSGWSILGLGTLAVAFVVVAVVLGSWLAPKLLDGIGGWARTDGTVMAVGLVVALAFARVASAAQLAPIVGAFVAGLAVGRSAGAEDLHRRLVPVGHLFIPIFFLQIGIDSRLAAFADPWVLGVAAVLGTVAVGGKLASGLGVRRGSADRRLVGIGMIPRGEVGLIFASLGLSQGVLDSRSYAVLLLVVLVSTVLTPPWLRRRLDRLRAQEAPTRVVELEPPGGWLRIEPDEVELAAEAPATLAGRIGLDAAVACATRRPGARLLSWVNESSTDASVWDEPMRAAFFRLLEEGTSRSWRFLEVTGLLERLLPELAHAFRQRPRDPFELDPDAGHRLPTLEDVRKRFNGPAPGREVVLLAALGRDAWDGRPDAAAASVRLATQIGLDPRRADETGFLVTERHLLPAAAARLDLAGEHHVLELASHIESAERLHGLYTLAISENGMESWERARLDELRQSIQEALIHPDLTGPPVNLMIEHRRRDARLAVADLPEREIRELLDEAPRRYLLTQESDAIARHLRMSVPRPKRGEVRLEVEPSASPTLFADDPGANLHVVMLDRPGVLAAIAGALADHGVSVTDAQISGWDRLAVDVFRVAAHAEADWEAVKRTIVTRDASRGRGSKEATPVGLTGAIRIDNRASPWYSIVELHARDRAGLLFRVAEAMSAAGLEIHEAQVSTVGGEALDTFWVTGGSGGKLTRQEESTLQAALEGRRRRWWTGVLPRSTAGDQSGSHTRS